MEDIGNGYIIGRKVKEYTIFTNNVSKEYALQSTSRYKGKDLCKD
jgi:hypothetical protein